MRYRNLRLPARLAFLAPLFALVACGGGGDQTSAPPAAPNASNLALTITSPAPSDNVITLGQSVRIEAQAQINSTTAADGTLIEFSTTGGTVSPATAATSNGIAWTTLTASSTGAHTLSVTLRADNATASATVPLYHRATPATMRILVPAYFYPTPNGSDWDRLTNAASSYPNISITAILNPNNGIFTTVEAPYATAIQRFTAAGGSIVGYVSTQYGNGGRSIAQIQANIDSYINLYGAQFISGIFLDEMNASANATAFYRTIYQYIKSRYPTLQVIGNPGTIPIADYAQLADSLVTFEGTATNWNNYDPRTTAASWIYSRSNQANAMLIHDAATCAAMQSAVLKANQARANTGWVYATNRTFNAANGTGNPWATLPSYWESLVGTVHALQQQSTLPPC